MGFGLAICDPRYGALDYPLIYSLVIFRSVKKSITQKSPTLKEKTETEYLFQELPFYDYRRRGRFSLKELKHIITSPWIILEGGFWMFL